MSPTGQGTIGVIGAGIIGLTAAWRLAQAGWRVTVFDAGKPASEASWAGAGMLAPGGEVEDESPLAQALLEARGMYAEFVEQLSGETADAIDFQQAGALDVVYSAEDLQALEERAARQAVIGIVSKPVAAERVRAFWPHVRREGLAGARFYPDDAVVNPRDLTAALLTALRQRGVALRESTRVRAVNLSESTASIYREGVTEPFEKVIVAAGAWSRQIALSSVPPLPELPDVEPIHGVLVGYHQPEQTCSTIVRHRHTYLLQRANGLLIAGASVERRGFSKEIDPAAQEKLTREASLVFPHLAETTPTEAWTGLRPCSAQPLVGPWHGRSLYLAYGHYRNGILLAPHTAQQLAKAIGPGPRFGA